MLRVLVFLFSVLSFGTLASQNYIQYHNLCNEGCQLIDEGSYVEAREKILDAIALVDEPLSVDYFNLAKCYSQLYSPEATQYYLELSLRLTNRGVKKYIEHGLWFEPVFGKEKWQEILNAKYVRTELTEFQIELNNKIDSLVFIDQYYRNLLSDTIDVYHPDDSLLIGLYLDSVKMNDVIVQKELEKIIEDNGWPGIKINGQTQMASLLLVHASDEWFYKMEQKLRGEIDLGNLSPLDFARISYRVWGRNDLPSRYNAFFLSEGLLPSIILENCKEIGVPLGRVRYVRGRG